MSITNNYENTATENNKYENCLPKMNEDEFERKLLDKHFKTYIGVSVSQIIVVSENNSLK